MEQQVFVDGVGAIAIIGRTVRFDLVALSPAGADGNGQAVPMPVQRIVMTTDGFLSSLEKLQSAAEALTRLAAAPAIPRRAADAPAEDPATPSPVVPLQASARRPFP